MLEILIIGGLAWACYKSPGFDKTVKLIIFAISVIGLYIFAREGVLGVWASAILSIPVNLFKGVFGILFA
jgi:hypothetical protein